MSGFVCPKCKEVSYIFGQGGAKQTANQLGIDFLGEIPLDPSIRDFTDQGKPIILSHPESLSSKIFWIFPEKLKKNCIKILNIKVQK